MGNRGTRGSAETAITEEKEIREGSFSMNVADCAKEIKDMGYLPNVCFCSDDLLPSDIIEKGHMNYIVRKAIQSVPVEDGNAAQMNENRSLALLAGYGIVEGAVATTVAHDSHNLAVLGFNTADMVIAANILRESQGCFYFFDKAAVYNGRRIVLPLAVIVGRQSKGDRYEQSGERSGMGGGQETLRVERCGNPHGQGAPA